MFTANQDRKMPPMTQLEEDLWRESSQRLRLWGADTLMRCKVANLSKSSTSFVMVGGLLFHLMLLADWLRLTKEEYLALCEKAYDDWPKGPKK